MPADTCTAQVAMDGAKAEPTCSTCKEAIAPEDVRQVQSENAVTGAKNQVRCKDCNNADGRIKRLLKQHQQVKIGYQEMSTEDRKKWMVTVGRDNLMGDDLKKSLVETITWSRIRRHASNFSAKGKFMDEENLKKAFEDKPDEKAAIKTNSHQMQCAITNKYLWWVPEYELSITNEEILQEDKKRKIEGEGTLKKAKKAKAEKTEKADKTNEQKTRRPRRPIIPLKPKNEFFTLL